MLDMFDIQVGNRIKKRRKTLGLTKAQLAEKIDISVYFLADIEDGKKDIEVNTLCKMVKALGVSADFILTGIENNVYANKIRNLLTQLPEEERRIAEIFIMSLTEYRS